jgi:hypothetical protein
MVELGGAVGALVAAYQGNAPVPGLSSSRQEGGNQAETSTASVLVPKRDLLDDLQGINKSWGEVIKLDESAGKITIETRFPRPFDGSERTFGYRASDPSMLKMVKLVTQLTVTKIAPSLN